VEHLLKTIEMFEEKAREQERALVETRALINRLCEAAQVPLKYDPSALAAPGTANSSPSSSSSGSLLVRPDEYYGKPQATAVREALTLMRKVGKAPASVEAIYDLLVQGGYDFGTKNREMGVQGLAVSIGKNSALFVKLSSGLIAMKDWYPNAPKTRTRGSKGGDGQDGDASGEASSNGETDEQAPAAADGGEA